MTLESIGTVRRWSMLAIALAATLCANVFINGAAFLIPTLHSERGMDLAEAGLLSSMPSFGMVVTLIAWGYVVDRVGERFVLALGSALTAAAAFAAASAQSLVAVGAFLFLGGMAAASSNSASGRLVVGWFPPEQRGLVMGIRQTAQPLGVGLGALVIPRLAESHGISVALLFPALVCAVSAVVCAVAVKDPPRTPRAEAAEDELANPYRGSAVLWRIHAVSVLLVVPQVVLWTFTLVWLMSERGWSAASAGAMVTAAQVLGARGRIAAGRWSDVVGSRLRPIRTIALAAAASMGLLALTDWLNSPISVAMMVDRLGDHRVRQRVSVHRHRRDRRPVLERARAGHAEHQPAADGRHRAAVVRWLDRDRRLSSGVRRVRAVSAGGDARRSRRVDPVRRT